MLDIIGSILQSLSEEPLKRTQLSYKANLDFRSLKRYTVLLNDLQLIELCNQNEDSVYYTITPLGKKFLTNYKILTDIVKRKEDLSIRQ